eukprot:4767494-Amphidinium_carterae.1
MGACTAPCAEVLVLYGKAVGKRGLAAFTQWVLAAMQRSQERNVVRVKLLAPLALSCCTLLDEQVEQEKLTLKELVIGGSDFTDEDGMLSLLAH